MESHTWWFWLFESNDSSQIFGDYFLRACGRGQTCRCQSAGHLLQLIVFEFALVVLSSLVLRARTSPAQRHAAAAAEENAAFSNWRARYFPQEVLETNSRDWRSHIQFVGRGNIPAESQYLPITTVCRLVRHKNHGSDTSVLWFELPKSDANTPWSPPGCSLAHKPLPSPC